MLWFTAITPGLGGTAGALKFTIEGVITTILRASQIIQGLDKFFMLFMTSFHFTPLYVLHQLDNLRGAKAVNTVKVINGRHYFLKVKTLVKLTY